MCGYLRDGPLRPVWLFHLLWSLSSTTRFCLQNCCPLDVFLFFAPFSASCRKSQEISSFWDTTKKTPVWHQQSNFFLILTFWPHLHAFIFALTSWCTGLPNKVLTASMCLVLSGPRYQLHLNVHNSGLYISNILINRFTYSLCNFETFSAKLQVLYTSDDYTGLLLLTVISICTSSFHSCTTAASRPNFHRVLKLRQGVFPQFHIKGTIHADDLPIFFFFFF